MEFAAGAILTEHGRHLQYMQQRVDGLEAGIVEREERITGLTLSLAELQRKIESKRLALDNKGHRFYNCAISHFPVLDFSALGR